MTFSQDIKRFTDKVEFRTHEVFTETASEVHLSITKGSPITGSKGQPVGQYGPGYHEGKRGGNLLTSWILSFPSKTLARIETNAEYAESIEDGVSYAHGGKPMQLRSTVGGFHSLKLTRAAIQKVVDAVTVRLYGNAS